MDLEINGDTALVVASSSGLGKASATALAREGANVVINSRDLEQLKKTKSEIESVAQGEVMAKSGDLTVESDIIDLVETAAEEYGTIDHLVTNAGGPPSGPFLETSTKEWYEAYDLLVMSVVRLVQAAEPYLRDGNKQGTIVNITSRTVKEAINNLVLSNSVRMSVIGLEKTLSKELAPEIRTNAVLPGPHETSRIQNLVNDAVERGEYDSYEEGLADWANNPLDRIGDPMKFAQAVAFLSSPCSEFINGTTLTIDGGSTGANI